VLSVALGAVALVAGLTGTWSPCGFSMVDTLAATGPRGRRGSVAACATFAVGALAGGLATFAGLSGVGALLDTTGSAATAIAAAAVALAAAVAEARGVRIVPQIRRQVPEPWRRVMPLPLAAALYGVLLGLGFTTFVLTFAVWALAGIAVALGDVQLGVTMGLAFGVGRALPVVVLAPLADRRTAARAVDAMAERPATLRGLRFADAAALAACALAIGAERADAATLVASPGTDPSASGRALAWDVPGQSGFLRLGGRTRALPGTDPAVGDGFVAWRHGSVVVVASQTSLAPLGAVSITGVDKLAISKRWLVYRVRRRDGGDTIAARRSTGRRWIVRVLASIRPPGRLSRPSLSGQMVVYGVAEPGATRIVAANLATGRRRTVRHGSGVQVLNPALGGSRLAYVAVSRCRQELLVGRLFGGHSRVVMRIGGTGHWDSGRDPGHTRQGASSVCPGGSPSPTSQMLWTTAVGRRTVFLTRLRPLPDGSTAPSLLGVFVR
jgi:hypothetical protein